MATKVFVMTHKKISLQEDDTFIPIHVGRACADDLGYLGDNTGDNISEYNKYFGELTGLYWIWKNYEGSENIGICHYRRYFVDGDNKWIRTDEFDSILNEYDVITSHNAGGQKTWRELFYEAHNPHDLNAMEEVIRTLYPEYYEEYERVIDGHDIYFGNLCVMPRELYDKYCEWMFSILFETSKYVDTTGYDAYSTRVYGFLSESMLMTWIRVNNLNPYECKVVLTSEKAEKVELKAAVKSLLSQNKPEEARQFFYDILKIRPDIELHSADLKKEIPIIEDILLIAVTERENGLDGMLGYSNDLDELIDIYLSYYKIMQNISNESIKENDISFLKKHNFSKVVLEGMLQFDRYELFDCAPLNGDIIRNVICEELGF